MTLKVCSTILFFLSTTVSLAQYRLSGTVTVQDSSAVHEITAMLNDGSRTAITDRKGNFVFEDVANGDYVVHFTGEEYAYQAVHVTIKDRDQHIRVTVEPRNQVLEEVVVTDLAGSFGLTRMRSVENLGIYEGKKSEVIIPEQLVANLATNNARQLYSRVAGLNIWENDGAGIQLSIGGRGLDPNRTSNFNVRQNGHDISADALGYPESYYTPPAEGVGRIEIVRGAASLQYGTQFGGLINFVMKKPLPDKKFELLIRQTGGSFGFYNAFASATGTIGKLSYYAFFQYKRGDGWRPNSDFNIHTTYANVNYAFTDRTKIGIDITRMGYLAQQPGGLSDAMFDDDPRQSNRARNWFSVDWNLLALHFDHKFSASSEFNIRFFGLIANRFSVGFRPNRVGTNDDGSERRDLIKGNFNNWGAEARYLKRYLIFSKPSVLLLGSRFYHGFNHSRQGSGSGGSNANFSFQDEDEDKLYDYEFPNENTSFFFENIVYLHEKLSLTPGVRFEYINTIADGYYDEIRTDLAGNIIFRERHPERRKNERNFVIAGLGIAYKPKPFIEFYSNVSQNYRSITFNDMRIINQSAEVDQGLQDEKGYSFDLGVRSEQTLLFNYDVSYFYLNYDNRIGEASLREGSRPYRFRTNIGQAIIQGVEAYGEIDLLGYLYRGQDRWSGVVFGNLGIIHSEYKKSIVRKVVGNKVEFIPDVNLKAGLRVGYRDIKMSLQYTHLSQQFTNAQNTNDKDDPSAVTSIIPSYSILDLSLSYQYKRYRLEGSVNNVANAMYYTRRATGYPGPGILPSDGRSFFLTLQAKI